MLKLEDLDLDMIASAMQDDGSMGLRFYLNLRTGEVVTTDIDSDDLEDDRHAPINRIESYESFRHMEEFTAELPEGEAHAEIEQSLLRRKPFRQFENTLSHFPEEQKAWLAYKDDAMGRLVAHWLVGIGAVQAPQADPAAENATETSTSVDDEKA